MLKEVAVTADAVVAKFALVFLFAVVQGDVIVELHETVARVRTPFAVPIAVN